MGNNNGGAIAAVSMPEVLAIVFVVLKLCGVIAWSWWWVLSPMWISWGIAIAILIIWFIVYAIAKLVMNKNRKRRRC